MKSAYHTISMLLLFGVAQPAYAAGIDAILLFPASLFVAFILTTISIYISPNRSPIIWTHFVNGLLFFVVLFSAYTIPDGFMLVVLYPLLSTFFILTIALAQRDRAKEARAEEERSTQ